MYCKKKKKKLYEYLTLRSTLSGYLMAVFFLASWCACALVVQPHRATLVRPAVINARVVAPPAMGVPRFFRWLTERFPQINGRISQKRKSSDYIDNFYLDMNGIIHTCTHGDGIQPGENLSEEQVGGDQPVILS